MNNRLTAGALVAALAFFPLAARACSSDLPDAKVGDLYAGVQNSTFLAPPLGDLALDLHRMKLYTRDGKEQWSDALFYLGASAKAGLVSVEARYDDGTAVSLDDLLADKLDKQQHAFVLLRVKRTDQGAALSQRSGLPDADQVLYVYNGKMVVDGVDGNTLKQIGTASFRIVTVRDHVVDVPPGTDAFLDDAMAMAKNYDYKLDLESWTAAHVTKPRHETALLGLNPQSCQWELVAVDSAPIGKDYTTHGVDDALAQIQGGGQEL
ncbi:MAG TPA: hypothetical protein VHE77_03025 [Dongiaceae bacterium]|jgi:hypothetical protein|nr:hypothetical protein [Dongiaceae bacterium]